MLSPRILHFTRNQVYWECSEIYANELHPAGLLGEANGKPEPTDYRIAGKTTLLDSINHIRIHGALPQGVPDETRNILDEISRCWLWSLVVVWYTSRALAYRSDILPALSGIAKHLAPHLGRTTRRYVAGMWRDQCMFIQLGWYTVSPSARISTELGPSWSWVTTDRPVEFPTFGFSVVSPPEGHWDAKWTRLIRENPIKSCKVLKARVKLATADPTGAVKRGGFVLLRGHLNRLVVGEEEEHCWIGGDVEPIPMTLFFDRADDDASHLFLFSLYTVTLEVKGADNQRVLRPHPAYLILSPVEGRRGTYERRGLATIRRWFGTPDRVEPPWETLLGQDIPSEGPFDEEAGYTIRVI